MTYEIFQFVVDVVHFHQLERRREPADDQEQGSDRDAIGRHGDDIITLRFRGVGPYDC